jgi:hypothetical protein
LKQDKLYKDAMITASVSGTTEVAEELLSYFVDNRWLLLQIEGQGFVVYVAKYLQ